MLVAPMPKRLETILTSSGCETSLGILFLVRKQILRSILYSLRISDENAGNEVGLDLIMKFVIDLDGRRPTTCAYAFYFFDREESISRHAFGADAEFLLEALVDFVSTAQHTTDVGADLNVEFTRGLEAEHRIIRGDIAHFEFGNADAPRDLCDDRVRKIAHLILRIKQHRDKR